MENHISQEVETQKEQFLQELNMDEVAIAEEAVNGAADVVVNLCIIIRF